ncbi:MAG: PDZ domain-containing protein [Liquorilactobacillus nagelii]|jgi:PDZ domain-containing protein|uniref:SepM family pheromone-processing serine protease n=1 Tax=Liquorilactobacillus nagelii TaxID=82688 RepID=UPI001CC9F9B1|nr:SepM family pheromone-processing serine protease [Liquorilactobacillus nagelii]MCI1634504.1 PDZ domain-containing protein [Liquorilactobacillus nagelii]MCI1920419.1 PDZ domain-containing protein [Liquorilactobacillus nagelii]MCI1976063.1 PDZ domain-containing protein [Liquorilactobacillus nagelii]ULQ48543.1 PDZ domain-containing protein [Liquorilactobacillus nagelii]
MQKKQRWWLMILLVILLAAGTFWPLPVYLETVGSAQNVAKYVSVAQQRDRKPGKLMLTYVELARATPFLYLASFFDQNSSRIPSNQITGGGDNQEFDLVQKYYMETAINQAKISALKLAGKSFKQQFQGIYVLSILKNSEFKNKLQVGDLIQRIDGKSFSSLTGMTNYLASKKANQTVKVNYLRQGSSKIAHGKIVVLPGTKRHGIGISLVEKTSVTSKSQIKANMDGIGGPSAGLMLALQMYSQLSQRNLKAGRKIAGTGTITASGQVGQIGGIDKKVIAANKAGATIFLSPAGKSNYREAKKTAKRIKTKMKIVPIKNLTQAVNYLAHTR